MSTRGVGTGASRSWRGFWELRRCARLGTIAGVNSRPSPAKGAEEGLAAADEVDDFEGVVGLDLGFAPMGARENIEIALDGDPVAGHADVVEEGGDGEAVGNLAALAVDGDGHEGVSAGGIFARERMVNRISSFPASVRA